MELEISDGETCDADFDEDVVFENSPLYQHLQDVGHLDFESSPMASARAQDNETTKLSMKTWYDLVQIKAVSLKHKLSGIHGNSSGATLEEEVNLQFQPRYTVGLCESTGTLLLPSDREFLQTYGPSLFHRKVSSVKKHVSIIMSISAAVLLFGCIIGIIAPPRNADTITVTLALLILLLLIFLSLQAKKAVVVFRLEKMHRENLCRLHGFLEMSQTFAGILKKSIRLIQESELIARGFLMITPKTPIARLEQSHLQGSRTQRQCPLLRKIVFHTARDLILTLKQSTCTLLEKFPLSVEVDNIGNYVSSIPIEDLGPCFTPVQKDRSSNDMSDVNDYDEAVIMETTDNYSLAALKAMSNLLNDLRSEFIRRLALCFCQEAYSDVMHWNESDLYRRLHELIADPKRVTECGLASLQKSYNFHRVGVLEREKKSDYGGGVRESNLAADNVREAVHSVEMHLQAALLRARELQEKLESYKDIGSVKAEGETITAELTHLLGNIDACKGCWEEGSNRLQRLLGDSSDHVQPTSSGVRDASKIDNSDVKSDKKPIQLFGLPEPEIEFDDQVFEAYTDPNEVDEAEWDYEPLSPDEKEQRKRQREESVRMLKELRNVLAIRTTEREKLKLKKRVAKGEEVQEESGDGKIHSEGKSLDQSANDEQCDDESRSEICCGSKTDDKMMNGKNVASASHIDEMPGLHQSGDVALVGREKEREVDCELGVVGEAVGNAALDELPSITDMQPQGPADTQPHSVTHIQPQGMTEVKPDDITDMHSACSSHMQSDLDTTESSDSNEPASLPTVIDRERLIAKLSRNPQGFQFASGIAAQAVAKSHNLNLCVQTFGDSDEDNEEELLEG